MKTPSFRLRTQYMYLLSAPFLAIAVYYLLQIIANSVTEPVLVLMAFSTGLISERIVSSIVEFANRTLGGSAQGSADSATQNAGERNPVDGHEAARGPAGDDPPSCTTCDNMHCADD